MENFYEIIKSRHSVRDYTDKEIEKGTKEKLERLIRECNRDGELNIQLITNESKAFDTFMAHYGKFNNVKNYIVMAGKKTNDLDERCGYYGEQLVLRAQELGLNTCWVGLTYGKGKIPYKVANDEKIVIVISIGYGANSGVSHKIKKFEEVSVSTQNLPEWYKNGVEYALLAPTAMNQQKFKFELINDITVKATSGNGFFTKVDLGIAKCHFEIGAGESNFRWVR